MHLLMAVGRGLYHMNTVITLLILSYSPLPVLRQKNFHKVKEQTPSFSQ